MIPLWAILALISAIILAVKEVFLKKLFNNHLKKSHVIFEQHLFTFLLALIIFFPKIEFASISYMWAYFIAKGLFLGLAVELYFSLLQRFEISKVAPLTNLSPVILLILSTIFLNEIISLIQLIGVIIVISATYFLEIDLRHHHKNKPQRHYLEWLKKLDWKNISITISILILFSLTAIIDKLIFKQNINVYTNLFYTGIPISLFFFTYFLVKKTVFQTFKELKKEPQLILISFFSFLSNIAILAAIAIPTAMASLIIPLKRTSTLFSAIFGGMLFHESHLLKKTISVILMLGGILLIVL